MTKHHAEIQGAYHGEIFHALADWPSTHERIIDLTGSDSLEGLLGLDQMGHFGPTGCDLVVDRIDRRYEGRDADRGIRLAELGSGFGGVVRYVADRLDGNSVAVERAVGVDLVSDLCEAAKVIGQSVPGPRIEFACASADALPIAASSLDVVICTGSMPHFADAGRVLEEARRVLTDDGVLILTEEVSIVTVGREPSGEFRALHPDPVFFLSTLEERVDQLERAGFETIEIEPLTDWACDLLRDRLKAIKIFRGAADGIFGATETATIIETLRVARDEFESGTLQPCLIEARPS